MEEITIIIKGDQVPSTGAIVKNCYGDHRIAMTAIIMGLMARKRIKAKN